MAIENLMSEGGMAGGSLPPDIQAGPESDLNLEKSLNSYYKDAGYSPEEVAQTEAFVEAEEVEFQKQKERRREELKAKRLLIGLELEEHEAKTGSPPSGENFEELAGFNQGKIDPRLVSKTTPQFVASDWMWHEEGESYGMFVAQEAAVNMLSVAANFANSHMAIASAEAKGVDLTGAVGWLSTVRSIVKAIPGVGHAADAVENQIFKFYGSVMEEMYEDTDVLPEGGLQTQQEILEHRLPPMYAPYGEDKLQLTDPDSLLATTWKLIPVMLAGNWIFKAAGSGLMMGGYSYAMLKSVQLAKKLGTASKAARASKAANTLKNLKAVKSAKEVAQTVSKAPGSGLVKGAGKVVAGGAKVAAKGAKWAGPKAAKLGAGVAITAGVADVMAFRKEEYRLANLFHDMGWGDAWGALRVMEPTDTEQEAYDKQFREGAILGFATRLIGIGAKAWYKAGKARKAADNLIDDGGEGLNKLTDSEKLAKAADEAEEVAEGVARGTDDVEDVADVTAKGEEPVVAPPPVKEGAPAPATKTKPAPKKKRARKKAKKKADTPAARKAQKQDDFLETKKEYDGMASKAESEKAPAPAPVEPPVQKAADEPPVASPAKEAPETVEQATKKEIGEVKAKADAEVDEALGKPSPEAVEARGQSVIVATVKTAGEVGQDLGTTQKRFIAEDLPEWMNPAKNKLVADVLRIMRVSPKAFALLRKNLPVGEINRLSREAEKAAKANEGIPFEKLTPEQQQLFLNMGFEKTIPVSALQEVMASTRIMLQMEDAILRHSHAKLSALVKQKKALQKLVDAGDTKAVKELEAVTKQTDDLFDEMSSAHYTTDKVNGVFSVAGRFLQSAVGRGRQKLVAKMRQRLQGLLDDGLISKAEMQERYLKIMDEAKIEKIDYDNFVREKINKSALTLKQAEIQRKIDGAWEKYRVDEEAIAKQEKRLAELRKRAKDKGCV